MSQNLGLVDAYGMGCPHCKDSARRLFHGMVGSAKALLQLDKAPSDVILHRRIICSVCPHALPCKGNPDEACWCGKLWRPSQPDDPTCGCNLRLKTRLNSEACPLNKW